VNENLKQFLGWVQATLNRRLNRPYIKFICVLVLAVYLLVFALTFVRSNSGRTIFGPLLGGDFGAFYVAGKIFNTQQPDLIYDRTLHHQTYVTQFPTADPDTQSPYVNAPFFILPFTILARLPYSWAYLLWVFISLTLYLAGFALMWRSLDAIPRDAWSVALLLSLSFMPFLVECLAGGQTSAVGFFFIALAISLERRRQYFLSGLALAVCAYKPTLLLLIAPMLLVTRRYHTVLGAVVGGVILALVSLLLVGVEGCRAYLNVLLFFKDASTSSTSGLLSWKYVDVNSFFRLLLGGHTQLRWITTGVAFAVGLPILLRTWWRSDTQDERERSFGWAITLTATLVLNLYLGIYDSTLVVLSALITSDLLYRRAGDARFKLPAAYQVFLLLLYVVPWITQPIARLTHVQLYTIVLATFGAWQISRLYRPRDLTT
jgi:Glycosyltransferase family 87